MQLLPPFIITARLLPGLKLPEATVSLEFDRYTQDRRAQFRWYIDMDDGREFTDNDLRSGVGGGTFQDMFGNLLAFLGAAAESARYEESTGEKGENTSLFPKPVVEWAYKNSDEISLVQSEIEETPGLIQKG